MFFDSSSEIPVSKNNISLSQSLRAKRGNLEASQILRDCRVANAPRNDRDFFSLSRPNMFKASLLSPIPIDKIDNSGKIPLMYTINNTLLLGLLSQP